jgi:hypothetical protein
MSDPIDEEPTNDEPLVQLPIDIINIISHYAGIIPSIQQAQRSMRAVRLAEQSYAEAGRPIPFDLLDRRYEESYDVFERLTEVYTTLLRLRHRQRGH